MNGQLTVAEQVDVIFGDIRNDLKNLLPANVRPERVQAAFMTAVSENREILRCNPGSVRRALLKCAQDGLVPDGRRAAIVPFGGQAQYLPMVQGIIQRAKELGDVIRINAQVVCENDKFEWYEGDDDRLIHAPAPLKDDRGAIVGAYAVFYGQDGDILHREVMSRSEIDRARAVSRASNSPAWKNWFSEMCRKTVIRRGAKYVATSDELRTIIEREDEYADLSRPIPERPDLVSKLNGTDAPGFNRDFIDAEISNLSPDPNPGGMDGDDPSTADASAPHREASAENPPLLRQLRDALEAAKDGEALEAVIQKFGPQFAAMRDSGDAQLWKDANAMIRERREDLGGGGNDDLRRH